MNPDTSEAETTQKIFDELGRISRRPWVMLSAGASAENFRKVLQYAYRAGASGFLAGRAIWWESFVQNFPDISQMQKENLQNLRIFFVILKQMKKLPLTTEN